ncbi:MAG: hypothetical protein FWE05_05140 [Defluviitaleaceae bacterium]|nr:hypothetical protein [Defluviitaleaceae bacterium]
MAIGYHHSFSKTLVLFDKALDTLDDEDSPNYPDAQIIRATMHNNLIMRILRAKFIDSDVPVEVLKDTFKIARILGVTLGYLYGEITEMPEKQDPYILQMKALMATSSEEDKKMILDFANMYLNNRYPDLRKK